MRTEATEQKIALYSALTSSIYLLTQECDKIEEQLAEEGVTNEEFITIVKEAVEKVQ